MRNRFLKLTFVFTTLHVAICVSSIALSFGLVMRGFDHVARQPGLLERWSGRVSGILLQPGMSVWNQIHFMNVPAVLQWGFIVLTSLLWGASLAWLVSRFTSNSPGTPKQAHGSN